MPVDIQISISILMYLKPSRGWFFIFIIAFLKLNKIAVTKTLHISKALLLNSLREFRIVKLLHFKLHSSNRLPPKCGYLQYLSSYYWSLQFSKQTKTKQKNLANLLDWKFSTAVHKIRIIESTFPESTFWF